jgi:hypothetical protein
MQGLIFICLAVKVVHLEMVSNLPSDVFIAALPRFITRRGKYLNLYSDKETTFVGAHHELENAGKFFLQKRISEMLRNLKNQ